MLEKLRAAWRVFKAARASDGTVKEAGGLENLTVDQLVLRQSVLRRAHQWGEAREAIAMALHKGPKRQHTHAFLLLGLGEICWHLGDSYCEHYYRRAEELTAIIDEEGEYRELADIYRHLEEHHRRRGDVPKSCVMREKKEWATIQAMAREEAMECKRE